MFLPSEEKCLMILNNYGTPNRVIAHCKEVARVSVILGELLKSKGFNINIELLNSAALLHDIARVSDNHEKVGADYIRKIGYFEVARLVEVHTKHQMFNPIKTIEEIDILCIGDRVVKEDRYVGVDERMDYIKSKAICMGKTEFVNQIDEGRKYLKNYIKNIEDVIGTDFNTLFI